MATTVRGKADSRVVASLVKLEHTATSRAPRYPTDLYHELENLVDLRYQRWQVSSAAAPPELAIALWIVAAALFGVLALALPERLDVHMALTVLIATALGSAFWVMATLAYPYCGSYAIGSQIITSVPGL